MLCLNTISTHSVVRTVHNVNSLIIETNDTLIVTIIMCRQQFLSSVRLRIANNLEVLNFEYRLSKKNL